MFASDPNADGTAAIFGLPVFASEVGPIFFRPGLSTALRLSGTFLSKTPPIHVIDIFKKIKSSKKYPIKNLDFPNNSLEKDLRIMFRK